MNIKILGTRGEIEESAPYHARKSGVLIDNVLLLDCGDKRFLRYAPRYLLLTHLHPDHAFFIRDHEAVPEGIAIYAPEKYDHESLQSVKKPFTIGDYFITPIPTIHSLKVQSTSYLIEHKGLRVLYTGDLLWIKKRYHALLKNLDAVITEASFMRTGGMVRRGGPLGEPYGHTGVPNLINLFKKFTRNFIFIHFGAWFYKDIPKARQQFDALAKNNNITIIVGYDGLEIELQKS